ncbi:amidase family protein, partial [Marinobacter sp.]|uniref:amidase family protein n=1 Tax=Marinobacter sp. TaxID=50741 RepID=UPI0035C75FFD
RFAEAVEQMKRIGGECVEIDFAPFLEAARLLYEGPWVAERYVAIESMIEERPDDVFPVTRQIISGGSKPRAAEAFKAEYRLRELKRKADRTWDQVDLVMTPTIGSPYTIAEVEAEPVQLNSNLGYYTNFMNLLDYSATAFPAGMLECGVPFGVTVFAPAFHDQQLLTLAERFLHPDRETKPEIPTGWIPIVVC